MGTNAEKDPIVFRFGIQYACTTPKEINETKTIANIRRVKSSGIWAYLLSILERRRRTTPTTASALKASITQERRNGFFHEQHVGYSVARTALLNDGRRLMEQRSVFRVSTFGKSQQIVTAGAVTLKKDY